MQSGVDAGLTAAPTLWVPIAEAARRHSVSKQAMHKRVSKLVELGRLSTKAGERNTVLVNIVALDRAIQQETDPAQSLRNGREPEAPGDDGDEAEPELPANAPTPSGGASYHASRANREAYQAENARLDLEDRLGRTADKTDVERHTMTVMRKIRDRFLAMPATIAERLAGAPDARAVRTILADQVRDVLTALANDLDRLADDDGDDFDDAAAGERTADQA